MQGDRKPGSKEPRLPVTIGNHSGACEWLTACRPERLGKQRRDGWKVFDA